MRTNFETLLELRKDAMDRARCPYDEEQIRQMVAVAVERVEARNFRWWLVRHYSVAACVAAMMVWGVNVYAVPAPSLPRSTGMAVNRQVAEMQVGDMLQHVESCA